MSHVISFLQDALQLVFLALGCVWLAVDLVRKLSKQAPREVTHAPAAAAAPAAPDAAITASAVPVAAVAPVAAPSPVALAQVSSVPAPVPVVAPALPLVLAGVEPGPVSGPTSTEGVPDSHLAVIAAAIHHLFGGRARLAGVSATDRDPVIEVDWAREGRRDIFASHRLR